MGGARISDIHANFLVNEGGATCADAEGLITLCEAEVKKRYGISLKREIITLGGGF
jgi:UDP-N-acetylmuramate dehydrogenase